MGRKKKYPTEDGNVVGPASIGNDAGQKTPSDAVLERLGFGNMICMDCNANNAPDADRCRKCGNDGLREKKHAYADE